MPKGRHLKPDFFTDKHVVSVSPLARLLYQGLWCYAADCGHLDDEPMEFKLRILPADNCDIEELLQELVDQGRIFRADGRISVPTITKHGRIDKRYETACDACKSQRDHAENGPSATPDPVVPTKGTRRDHDGTTRAGTPHHDADGDGDGDGDGEVMVMGSRTGKPVKRAQQLPDTWQPNDKHREIAATERRDLEREVQNFRDDSASKGRTAKDWDAAFRNWLRSPYGFRYDRAPQTLAQARDLELPPDGLSDEQYAAWYAARRRA